MIICAEMIKKETEQKKNIAHPLYEAIIQKDDLIIWWHEI